MGVAVCSSDVVSTAPSSSGGGVLTLCPCSSVGSLSRETVLHELLQRESFPRAADLHELPQRGSLPRGAVLQEQAAPVWVPHGVTSPAMSLLQDGLPTGSQSPLGASTCSGIRSSLGCRWTPALPRTSMGCRGTAHLTMVFSIGCRGMSSLAPGALPSLALVSAELFLSHSLTPLSHCRLFFLLLLNYVLPEALPPSLMGSALASRGSVLEPAGIASIGHRGSFWQLLTEATPVAPTPQKPCHANPIHQLIDYVVSGSPNTTPTRFFHQFAKNMPVHMVLLVF